MLPDPAPPGCTDRRAVSPVIGVVMMVAITVVLAGVVAVFVLGVGVGAQLPPQASLAMDQQGDDALVVTHLSGEAVALDELYLRGDVHVDGSLADLVDGPNDRLRGGVSVTVPAADLGGVADGDVVALVWDVGDESTVLVEHRWRG